MNNSVFDDSEDAAIRFRLLKWTVKYLDLGTGGIAPWNVPGPCEERAWKSGAFQTKTKIRPLRRNACDTVQSHGVTRLQSFKCISIMLQFSVSWLTSVVTQTAPRRDFNNALYWCKISIISSSLHDLQSFNTKRTKWGVLVFFAFFPLWVTLLLQFPTLLLDRVVMLPKHVVRILRWIRFVPAVPVPIGCFLLGRDFHGEKSIKFFSFHVKNKSEVYNDVAFIFPKGSKCVRICRKVGNAVNFADWRWMNYILFRSRGECDRSLVHQLPLTIADGSKQTVGWLKTAGCAVVWKQHDTHRWNCIGNRQSHHPLRKLAEA